MTVSFFVPGRPIPQGSHSAAVVGQARARVLEGKSTADRARLRAWRDSISWIGGAAMARARLDPFDGPVAVSLVFVLERPKTVRAARPATKPDLDKLTRAVLDGLGGYDRRPGRVLRNDSRVVDLEARKIYERPGVAAPGVLVRVRPLDDDAAAELDRQADAVHEFVSLFGPHGDREGRP